VSAAPAGGQGGHHDPGHHQSQHARSDVPATAPSTASNSRSPARGPSPATTPPSRSACPAACGGPTAARDAPAERALSSPKIPTTWSSPCGSMFPGWRSRDRQQERSVCRSPSRPGPSWASPMGAVWRGVLRPGCGATARHPQLPPRLTRRHPPRRGKVCAPGGRQCHSVPRCLSLACPRCRRQHTTLAIPGGHCPSRPLRPVAALHSASSRTRPRESLTVASHLRATMSPTGGQAARSRCRARPR
jgi:hypothetical protein